MPKNYDDWNDEDWEEDGDEEYVGGDYTEEEEQSCFDLLVASFVSNVLSEDTIVEDEEDRTKIIDQIMDILDQHLDEEGSELLSKAFLKFEKEYTTQVHTHEIISNLDWNKDKND